MARNGRMTHAHLLSLGIVALVYMARPSYAQLPPASGCLQASSLPSFQPVSAKFPFDPSMAVLNPALAGCMSHSGSAPQDTQACFAFFDVAIPSLSIDGQFAVGLCALNACTAEEVGAEVSGAEALLSRLNITGSGAPTYSATSCYPFSPYRAMDVSPASAVVMAVFCLIALLMVFGSVFTLAGVEDKPSSSGLSKRLLPGGEHTQPDGTTPDGDYDDNDDDDDNGFYQFLRRTFGGKSFVPYIRAFSVPYNLSRLSAPTPEGAMGCVVGMRAFSMMWVVLGHTLAFAGKQFGGMEIQFGQTVAWKTQNLLFQIVMGGEFAVDSFFAMSGFLVGYSVLKKLRADNGLSGKEWAMFYVHRFWRLSPPFYFLIFVSGSTVLANLTEGPSFETIVGFNESCKEYWWSSALYIQNLYPDFGNLEKTCMSHGWYLANDMQFYVISPLFLMAYWKNRRLGFLLAASVIIATVIGGYFKAVNIHYTPNILKGDQMPKFYEIYVHPWYRMGAYLVGMCLSFVLEWGHYGPFAELGAPSSGRSRTRNGGGVPGVVTFLCYLCFPILLGLVVFGTVGIYRDYDSWNQFDSSLYGVGSRVGWSIGLCMLIFLCVTGNGGWINKLLSWSWWTTQARLSYSAYLVHVLVLLAIDVNDQAAVTYSDVWFVEKFFGQYCISMLFALLLWLAVEKPFMNMERLLFKR